MTSPLDDVYKKLDAIWPNMNEQQRSLVREMAELIILYESDSITDAEFGAEEEAWKAKAMAFAVDHGMNPVRAMKGFLTDPATD